MRMISTTLLLIVSFNLFAGYDAEVAACKDAGKEWTNGKGCHISEELEDVREAARECEGLKDQELTTCTQNVAESSAEQKNKDFNKGKVFKYGFALAQVIGVGYSFIKSPNHTCSQTSYWLMMAGSVSSLLGEILARTKYKKSMKEVLKKYESTETEANSSEESTTNKQLEAFDRLIEIEAAREKAERTRQTLYTVSTVSFAAAAVAAALETWVPTLVPLDASCAASGSISTPNTIDVGKIAFYSKEYSDYAYLGKVSKLEFIEIVMRKVTGLVIPSAVAADVSTSGAGVATAGGTATAATGAIEMAGHFSAEFLQQITLEETKAKIQKKAAVMRLASSVMLGVSSGLLMSQAKTNKKKAQDRQEELQDLRNKFAESRGIITTRCSTEDRSNTSNPDCYCYLEDGTKDARKGNLKICVDKWAQSSVSGAGNYNTTGNTSVNTNIKTCVTKSYESDLGCKCKSTSSCLTVGSNGLSFGSGLAWASKTLNTSNSVYSNGLESAGSNLGTFENQAATLNTKLDELQKDSRFKNAIEKAKLAATNYRKKGISRLKSKYSGSDLAKELGASGQISKAANKEKEAEKKIVAALPPKFSNAVKAKKLESFDFDLGDVDNSTEIIGEDNSAANSDYEYNAVLHKNPDASIFKILSNRYMKTGVKSLFKEDLEENTETENKKE